MSEIFLQAIKRETGKKTAKSLRRNGMIPAIVYGDGKEGIPIAVKEQLLRPLIYTQHLQTVRIHIPDQPEEIHCILKDYQLDPVTDRIVHCDFQILTAGHKITVEVPVVLVGEAPGVKAGGILQHLISKLEVECFPKDIPDHIEIDISALDIGDSLTVADLRLQNVQPLNDPEEVIVTILPPTKEEVAPEAEEESEHKPEKEAL